MGIRTRHTVAAHTGRQWFTSNKVEFLQMKHENVIHELNQMDVIGVEPLMMRRILTMSRPPLIVFNLLLIDGGH